jgi:hypothetical protein
MAIVACLMGIIPILFRRNEHRDGRHCLMTPPMTLSSPLATALKCAVGTPVTARQVADAAWALWSDIDDALSPFFGKSCVATLYEMSLAISRSTHPWLPVRRRDAAPAPMDLAGLRDVIAQRSPAGALSAATSVFESFYSLVAGLVGSALAEHMLAAEALGGKRISGRDRSSHEPRGRAARLRKLRW